MSKERYVWVNGKKEPVSEDIYRAVMRSVWRKKKQDKIRMEKERSLDEYIEAGYGFSSGQDSVEDIVADKLLLTELMAALTELGDDERFLIDEFFYQDKTEREVAEEIGIPRNTAVYRKNKVLEKLKKILDK
jgi:RNA polymerase sigma factor (sigma-70 family)